jgi:hypothetical protein
LNDDIKAFLGSEVSTTNKATINQMAVPLVALPSDFNSRSGAFPIIPQDRANGTYIGVLQTPTEDTPELFIQTTGKSVLYDLYESEPIPRTLFLDGYTARLSDKYILGRIGENSVTEALLLPLIRAKTGRNITVRAYLKAVDLKHYDFESPVYFRGSPYLVQKTDKSLSNLSSKVELQMDLELLSEE